MTYIFSDPFQDDEDRHERTAEPEHYDVEEDEGDYSDDDGFIVDDDGRPITEKRKRRKPIFNDA